MPHTKHGWWLVFLSAVGPLSTKLVCAVAGMTGMPLPVFALSLAAASLPPCLRKRCLATADPRSFRSMTPKSLYHRETHGIRVTVRPSYLPHQSQPLRGHFVFAYFVRLENISRQSMQLVSRYWLIHDSGGEDIEVEGEGVVGEQPVIPPGRVHEYQSFCVLRSPSGHMEGHYNFVGADEVQYEVVIPRINVSHVRGCDRRI